MHCTCSPHAIRSSLSHLGSVRALALTSAGRAKFASLLCGEGKLELTESAREFQKVSAPQSRCARSGGEEATGPDTPVYFFCGSNNFSPFLNTAKIACEGQASRQRRQLSRQREGSNL